MLYTIDLHYLGQPGSIGSYLLVGPDGPVLIEVGPGSTFDALVTGLAKHGFSLSDIKHALLTHIHLDHAGAAGLLAEHGATIYVHEFGAKHLIDPSKLIASAARIYGDAMEKLWGRILPVPERQVVPVRDGDVINVGGLQLTAIETPGHARHHHAFAMDTDDGPVCFTGDAAAMIVPGIPGTRYISLPTPPPEFELQAWLSSIEKLKARQSAALYLTHFGRVDDVDAHWDAVAAAVREHAEWVRRAMEVSKDEAAILAGYGPWVREQALTAGIANDQLPHFVSQNLLSMNVTGLIRYWTKREG